MKNLAKLFVILVLTGFVFVGCTPDNSGETEEPQDTGPIVLQWWGVFWDEGVVESLIVEYQELNPNVKIEYANKWPGGGRQIAAQLYQDEINRVLRDRNPTQIPDIFMINNTWVGEYEDYLAPAPSEVIDWQSLQNAFYPVVAEDFAHNQQVMGLPMWIDVLAILYNKEILSQVAVSEPPDTWVDFRDLAFDLTQKSGNTITQSGFAAGTSSNVSFSFELLNLLLLQNGVRMIDSNDNPIFSSSVFSEETVQFYQDFAETTGSWNEDMDNESLEFLNGKVGMIAVPSWRYHDILYFNQRYNLGLDIGVAPMPQVATQTQRIDWATYWGNVVAKDRPNSAAAWDFINWITQPEQLRKLRQNELLERDFFGFLYPRVDMQQELLGDPFLRVFNDSLPTAESWYMINGLEVKPIFAELIQSNGAASNVAAAENDVESVFANQGIL